MIDQSEVYLRKILWWVRFMVTGLVIWACTEGTILLWDRL